MDTIKTLDLDQLSSVRGGDGDAAQCMVDTAAGAIPGAALGPEGAFVGGAAAYLTSPACGDGERSPAAQMLVAAGDAVGGAVNAVKGWF